MTPAEVRSLTPDKATLLYQKSLTGNKQSVMDFFSYSVWMAIRRNDLIGDKENVHDVLMARLKIKVKIEGKRGRSKH